MTEAPSIFSKTQPKLQIYWDATSLKSLMFCPRHYQLTILEGWRPRSLDFEFGHLYHASLDLFDKQRLAGVSPEQAQEAAVRLALETSGAYTERDGERVWEPWGGVYVPMWRCAGTEPYKNDKGNKAKCPYAHVGVWQSTLAPYTCGECGSATEEHIRWVPRDQYKNRETLIRLVVWYTEEQRHEGNIKPYAFPNGTPAVELSFRIPMPDPDSDGGALRPACSPLEAYVLCGYLDSICSFGPEYFIRERKTTARATGKAYFAGFSPDAQVDTYDLVGSILFASLDIRGVLLEASQVLVSGARFSTQPLHRNEALREEFLRDLKYWLGLAEKFALDDYWPMNRGSCWVCKLREVCARTPSMRGSVLADEEKFERRFWNPLEER